MIFEKRVLIILSALLINIAIHANYIDDALAQLRKEDPALVAGFEQQCPQLLAHSIHASYDSGWFFGSMAFCAEGAACGFVYGVCTSLLINLLHDEAVNAGLMYVLNKVFTGAQLGFVVGLVAQQKLFNQRLVPHDIKTGSFIALAEAIIIASCGELLAATPLADPYIQKTTLRSGSKRTAVFIAMLTLILDTLITKHALINQKTTAAAYFNTLLVADTMSEETKHALCKLKMFLIDNADA